MDRIKLSSDLTTPKREQPKRTSFAMPMQKTAAKAPPKARPSVAMEKAAAAVVDDAAVDKLAAALAIGSTLAEQDLLGLRKEALEIAGRLMAKSALEAPPVDPGVGGAKPGDPAAILPGVSPRPPFAPPQLPQQPPGGGIEPIASLQPREAKFAQIMENTRKRMLRALAKTGGADPLPFDKAGQGTGTQRGYDRTYGVPVDLGPETPLATTPETMSIPSHLPSYPSAADRPIGTSLPSTGREVMKLDPLTRLRQDFAEGMGRAAAPLGMAASELFGAMGQHSPYIHGESARYGTEAALAPEQIGYPGVYAQYRGVPYLDAAHEVNNPVGTDAQSAGSEQDRTPSLRGRTHTAGEGE